MEEQPARQRPVAAAGRPFMPHNRYQRTENGAYGPSRGRGALRIGNAGSKKSNAERA